MLGRGLIWLLLLVPLCGVALAAPELVISHPWIRAMPPGSHMNAAYLVLKNQDVTELRIVGAHSPAAKQVSLHRTLDHGGMSHMQPAGTVVLKSGATQVFAPGGLHLMLNSVTKLLVAGDKVPLCLMFVRENGSAGQQCQQFPVLRKSPL